MNKCILLGIDAPLSPATRQAIRTVNELVGPMTSQIRLVLVHVISIPYVTVSTMGLYASQSQQNALTVEQREEAEKTLATVRAMLQELDMLRVDMCIRSGSPAEEIVRVARETQASLVIIGSRGNGLGQRLRRFFMGSKSRRVLQSASCPVMIVTSLPRHGPADLVAWYEGEITRYLQENPGGLTVFQPREVARLFAPVGGKAEPGRKEQAAAVLALEHLASEGLLCRHEVAGELRYVND
jgi:nucleotide-binding universal stress UspA family protein